MTDIRNDLKIQALEVGIRKQRTTEGLQRLLESNIPEFHEHRFLIRELHRQRREIKHVERMRKSIPLN